MAGKKYRIEFAVHGVNEFKVLNKLTEIFGADFKYKVSVSELSRRSGLFFVEHQFLECELSDSVYARILESSDIVIVGDVLSLERSHQILEMCLPVEALLKKLLIYVYSGIVEALEYTPEKKTGTDFCCSINNMTFGELLNMLEIDLAAKSRKRLLAAGSQDLISLVITSSGFDDFQAKLREQMKKRTVWDEVQVILERPIPYSYISGQLKKLLRLRNKAAHLQTITECDLKVAQHSAQHVLKCLSGVRDDYKDELRKSFAEFAVSMQEIIKRIGPEEIARADKELHKAIGKVGEDFLRTVKTVLDNPDIAKDSKTQLALKRGGEQFYKNKEIGSIVRDIEEKGLAKCIGDMGSELN